MIIQLGEQVQGTNGELGRIDGVTIDPNSQTADQMVIKHGFPIPEQRLAVLSRVVGVETDIAYVDLSRQDYETLERYDPDAYGPADPGNIDPVKFTSAVPDEKERPLREDGARIPPLDAGTVVPPQAPQAPGVVPEDERLTVISEQTGVWDSHGEKLGEVSQFAVETTTGQPTRLTLRHGLLGRTNVEVPVEWVQRFTPKGIVLKVTRKEVEALERSKREP